MGKIKRLQDVYRFPGFVPLAQVRGVFGDPYAVVITLRRRRKKRAAVCADVPIAPSTISVLGGCAISSCGDKRVYLEFSIRRVWCRQCGGVKREGLEWLADNPLYTKRFAFFVGRRCRESTIQAVAEELHLHWHTVKELDKQYMREQLRRAGSPAPRVIGIDEISVGKGHQYRIVVSDLERGRPIWFGGKDRSEASLDEFFAWLGPKKSRKIRLAVMDMWKAFRKSTLKEGHAPQARIVYDKFHILSHLGKAMDKVRKQEYARLSGKDRRFIKGQKYHLLTRWENLTTRGKAGLEAVVPGQQATEQGLPPPGVVRPTLGLQPTRLGSSVLRQLAEFPQVATPGAISEVRRYGRSSLGRHRGLLPRGEQGALGIRRGIQQQGPCPPASGLRLS